MSRCVMQNCGLPSSFIHRSSRLRHLGRLAGRCCGADCPAGVSRAPSDEAEGHDEVHHPERSRKINTWSANARAARYQRVGHQRASADGRQHALRRAEACVRPQRLESRRLGELPQRELARHVKQEGAREE